MPSELFACPCKNYKSVTKKLIQKTILSCQQKLHESDNFNLVFLGSGGLHYEMSIVNAIFQNPNTRRPDRIILVDPIYSSHNHRTQHYQMALWEFSTNINNLSKFTRHNTRLTVLKNLDDMWPIEPFNKFLFIGIDPDSLVGPHNGSYFPEFYRAMAALNRLMGPNSFEAFIAKGYALFDKGQLLKTFSRLPHKYKEKLGVNYQIDCPTYSTRPLLRSYAIVDNALDVLPMSETDENPQQTFRM